MKAALLPDRGVVKVAGDDARNFLHGLVSADILKLAPGKRASARCCRRRARLLQISSLSKRRLMMAAAFSSTLPRALAKSLVDKLNLYKLRARVIVEDLSEVLGVLAAWDGHGTTQSRPLLRRPAPAGARAPRHAAAASCHRGGL